MERVDWVRRLVEHEAADDAEEAHVRAVVELLTQAEAPFARATTAPGHVTASAFVVSPDGELLLIHHGTLGRWLQPGGHIEPGDVDLEAAARREVLEETGVGDLIWVPGCPWLLDVDVHVIPANPAKGEEAHRHFDVRLLFRAGSRELCAGSDARDARWVPLDEVARLETDASVLRAVAKLRRRLAVGERHHAPATARNREPILEVLRGEVPPGARVLEVGSGTGEHAAFLAPRLAVAGWQPTELTLEQLPHVAAWTSGVGPVLPPAPLDASRVPWDGVADASLDVVFSANVVHISPWSVALGLLEGAARSLRIGGRLVLYGPFRVAGEHTAPSNARFDQDLRARDRSWGVRDLEAVLGEAGRVGLRWRRSVPLPANNLAVIFVREPDPDDPRIGELLGGWFGSDRPPSPAHQAAWWSHDPAIDEALRVRFGALHREAVAGELQGWARTSRGRVALIILLDQISRQVHRGEPAMYAQDHVAQALTLDALHRGMHREVDPFQRQFLLMPLMHAEDARLQALSVAAFRDLADEGHGRGDPAFEGSADFAVQHRDIIERFGRFPHRNAILGRASTPDELRFLEEPGSSF